MKFVTENGYVIEYMEDYLNTDIISLKFFSKFDIEDSFKIKRKYLSQISKRTYYQNGSKRWNYELGWFYEVNVKKSDLIFNEDESMVSYIAYDLNGVLIINNTSHIQNANLQYSEINHCKFVKKRDFLKILNIAIENDEKIIYESKKGILFNGDYADIMFIARYARFNTNFSKSKLNYFEVRNVKNPLVEYFLENGISEENISCKENYLKKWNNFKNIEREIIEDLKKWKKIEKEYESSKKRTIPFEIFEAVNKIESFRRMKKRR